MKLLTLMRVAPFDFYMLECKNLKNGDKEFITESRFSTKFGPRNRIGERTGEVLADKAVLHTYLAEKGYTKNKRVAPMAGYAQFVVEKKSTGQVITNSGWHFVDDYITGTTKRIHYNFRWTVKDLIPNTEYEYYVITKSSTHSNVWTNTTIRTKFKTAPVPTSKSNIVFTVVTGLDQYGKFKVFKKIIEYNTNAIPNFNIFTGDTVYYDTKRFYPHKPPNISEMGPHGFDSGHVCLKRWNIWPTYYSYTNMMNFFRKIPNYWQVDDHDYWVNNINRKVNDGWQIFRNAHPTPGTYGTTGEDDEDYYNSSSYPISTGSGSNFWRSIRWGKHLEIFIEEGHHHRIGRENKIFGTEQIKYLAEAINNSKATFKVFAATTPLLGPPNLGANVGDDKHSSPKFDNETVVFMTNIFSVSNVYFVVGDRHWKYIAKINKGGAVWNSISNNIKDNLENIREYCCGATGEDTKHYQAPVQMITTCDIGRYVNYDRRGSSTPGYMRVEVSDNNNNPKITFELIRLNDTVAFSNTHYDQSKTVAHFVDLNGNHQPPFTNWVTAATNIQTAINISKDGDSVIVSNGIYSVGGANTPGFSLFNRVMIDKDITVESLNGAKSTIIDGGGVARCVYVCPYGELKGFTLTNGIANTN